MQLRTFDELSNAEETLIALRNLMSFSNADSIINGK